MGGSIPAYRSSSCKSSRSVQHRQPPPHTHVRAHQSSPEGVKPHLVCGCAREGPKRLLQTKCTTHNTGTPGIRLDSSKCLLHRRAGGVRNPLQSSCQATR